MFFITGGYIYQVTLAPKSEQPSGCEGCAQAGFQSASPVYRFAGNRFNRATQSWEFRGSEYDACTDCLLDSGELTDVQPAEINS